MNRLAMLISFCALRFAPCTRTAYVCSPNARCNVLILSLKRTFASGGELRRCSRFSS